MGERTVLISWNNDHGMSGTQVPVTATASDAIELIAMRMACIHFDILNPPTNVHGMGSAIAHGIRHTDPALWERFKGTAVGLVLALHGSGEKDLARTGRSDGRQYFEALADLAEELRRG